MSKSSQFVFALAMLVIASIACNMPSPKIGGPEAPPAAPTASGDALESFKEKWSDLNLSTPSGPFSISFTEAELTSALAAGIAEAEAESGTPVPIQNPQLVLADGQILLYAQPKLDVATTNGLITSVPSLGANGLIDIEIVSAEFGPLEIDPAMLEDLEIQVEQAINVPIQTSPYNIALNAIVVDAGRMTVSGSITP